MAKVSREHILDEIRRTAAENGGNAVGQKRFAELSGISDHAWRGRFWRTWGDAVTAAGLTPNVPTQALDREQIVASLAALVRRLKRFPTEPDLRLERERDPSFPSLMSLKRYLGTRSGRSAAIEHYVQAHPEYEDVLPLLPVQQADATEGDVAMDADASEGVIDGHVYLMKFGKHYKVGRTESVPTRHRQVNLELPEKAVLIHKIATDDTAGIEAYWKRRFAAKHTNGEWFALNRDDVRAFKRRRVM